MPLRKVLVATDFSEPSRVAVEGAALIAAARHADVLVVHVFDTTRDALIAEARRAEEERALRLKLEGTCGELAHGGVTATPLLLEGFPDEMIADAARAQAVDLVVVGSHGRTGPRRVLVGSVAEHVVRMSDGPVLVVRAPTTSSFTRILAATDFTPQAERALETAVELAAPGASIDVVHFIQFPAKLAEPSPFLDEAVVSQAENEAHKRGQEAVARHRRPDMQMRFATGIGGARDGILQRLESEQHDLVALGSHGRRGVRRFLLGSVAQAILRHAPCSVLIGR